jgi:hypothetical protein
MSLVTYEEAFPWAESLRSELLEACSERSRRGKNADFIKSAHCDLSAREIDVVLDWAVGGTPEGGGPKPAAVQLQNEWAAGKPDLMLPILPPFEMPSKVMELTQRFLLATALDRPREIRAIDLLPGTPAVVRDATIAMQIADAPVEMGRWIPRQVPAVISVRPGTTLPAGATLIVTIHYKKTWKYESQAVTDRSTLGIYFQGK